MELDGLLLTGDPIVFVVGSARVLGRARLDDSFGNELCELVAALEVRVVQNSR